MVMIIVGYLSKYIRILYTDKGRGKKKLVTGARYVQLGPNLLAAAITELQIIFVTAVVKHTI